MHTNAYKYHHAVARSMTGLAAGGLARGPAARSMTGLRAARIPLYDWAEGSCMFILKVHTSYIYSELNSN